MSLSQLAEEYLISADFILKRIAFLRLELTTAQGDEALKLRRRLQILYQEVRELRRLSHYLHQYYNQQND